MADLFVGVDIGGTKILVAVVDTKGKIIAELEEPTVGQSGVTDMYQRIIRQIKQVGGHYWDDIIGIGVGCPGHVIAVEGIVKRLRKFAWYDFPFRDMLERDLGKQVVLDNDANAAALGEGVFGAAQGVKDYIYITVSTGIGAGIVINGQLYRGHQGGAGEVGHTIVQPGGPECSCGRFGCLQTYASGPAMAWLLTEKIRQGNPSLLIDSVLQGKALTGRDVFGAAQEGDPLAQSIINEGAQKIGLTVVNLISVFNPEMIVLGGGVIHGGQGFFTQIRDFVLENTYVTFKGQVKIIKAGLGNKAGVIGAAKLAEVR